MDKQSYIDEAEKELLHTYNRFSLVLDHGEGVHLYDTDGNAYLDFAAGIAVCALGYSNEHHKEALKAQVDKLLHTSNLYYNAPVIEAADKVLKASKMDRIFFTNSGTEAIEGAIKAAKKYAFTRDGHAGHEIIAMNHSFHGRSIGALSVTGNAHYQEPFEPLMPGVKFADFNDLESVKAQITDKTCAIIMETVQGEGGIRPLPDADLRLIRALCDQTGALLVLDEVQSGMGRTGKLFAHEWAGIAPDIMPHIFEPFFSTRALQSPVAAHASGGKTLGRYVGLGLAVARSLAHARGGELTAANAADGGAEFCLSLPLAESLGEHPTPKAKA